nr:hypothetical protein [Tanacetum cinerariifolium]
MDRCKGCKNYLTVPIGQPCSFCYKVNKPKKTNRIFPQLLQYIDDYANRPSNNNYYNGSYGPPLQTQPSYGGYYAPPPVYGPGYYSPQQQPPVYSDDYYRPPPQAVSPPIAYANGYNSNFYQQPSMVHEKKRAVLCGVTYRGHKKTLPASVNNVRSMHQLLLKLGFPNSSIRILTEEEADPNRSPTRRNILMAIEWLMKGCRSGDSLVFYYAGHGSHVVDYNGDEKDGINRGGFYKWEDHHPSHVASYGGTSGGRAICISACDDHQNSADTSAFTGTSIGALTYSFIQAVQSARKLTYGDLLDNMRQIVREAQERQGVNAPFASSTSQSKMNHDTALNIDRSRPNEAKARTIELKLGSCSEEEKGKDL